MRQQLILVDERPAWKLDSRTRSVGREGVAAARAVLARATTAPEHSLRQHAA
ncbi:MAG: hypothetical protein WA797_01035 [Acidimicrobiales bacterium]